MQIVDLVPDLRPIILAARQMRDARNSLERFLPNTNVQAVSYRLGRRKRLDQTVPVRAFGAPAIPIRRPGVVDIRGDLPALTPRVDLSEVDLNTEFTLAQQLAGLQVDWQPWVTAAAGQVALTVDNTLELMRGAALSTGEISLTAEDGTVHSVDFDIPAGQKIEADDPWDPSSPAAIFADYAAAHEAYLDASGAAAGVALTTAAVRTIMVSALQALYPQQPVGSDQLSAYLANRNLPDVVTYDRQLSDEAGNKTRVYPQGTLTFLPSNDDPIGRTELGITQEAVQQVQRVQPNGETALDATTVAGLTVVTLGQEDPVERAVKGAAVGMPVIQDADSIVILSGLIES